MRRATSVLAAGSWPVESAIGTVTLAWDDRHRRRIRLTDDAGEPFLLDLDRATALGEGDGLALNGDGVLCVRSAAQPVLEVACRSAAQAARIAWHLGNRHTPIQVLADGTLRLLDDHVLADMLRRLGAEPIRADAPFEPEAGAYAGDPATGHASRHDRHDH